MQSKKIRQNAEVSGPNDASKRKRRPQTPQNRVDAELRKLQRITKDAIPKERRDAALSLLPNIAFLKVKLDDNGGGQSGLREHPGFSAYNKLFTTFARAVKQLTDMMPSGSVAADALTDYINETRTR